MTQEQFLKDMIDTGYVKVKANELRKLLQDYRKRERIMNQQIKAIDDYKQRLIYWQDKYENLKYEITKNTITVDLEV